MDNISAGTFIVQYGNRYQREVMQRREERVTCVIWNRNFKWLGEDILDKCLLWKEGVIMTSIGFYEAQGALLANAD